MTGLTRRSFFLRVALGLLAALLVQIGLVRPASAADVRPVAAALVSVGMPGEFAQLAEKQQLVADVYFGGRAIGQFEVEATPGSLRILQVDRLVAALPGVTDVAAVTQVLSSPTLDTNTRFICHPGGDPCDHLTPDVAGIVFDQSHFRMDLFVNPRLLVVRPVSSQLYLSPSSHGFTLVDTIGATVAGGEGQESSYDIRNRAILARGDARLESEASVSSGGTISIDTLAAVVDRPDKRYTAGLFYTPGMDLVGRRRIIGAGMASQFDTRTDRDVMTGTPLIVYLSQRSRVDLYSQGRLMSSHMYEAGNQSLDTSSLPDGSYPVEIRIQEVGGGTRTERRFFTKSMAIPPPGHMVFFADAGVLAVERPGRLLAVEGTPLLSLGVARRVGSSFAFDATMTATNSKAIVEIGTTLLSRAVQARVALLGSSSGDYGILAQASSTSLSRLGYSIDVRHVESHNDRALLPEDDFGSDTLSAANSALQDAQQVGGSFTQLVANLSYRIARAQFGLSGYLRRDVGQPTSYAIGPSVHWPIVQSQRLSLTFDGSFAQTDRGRSMAFGLRLQVLGKRSSLTAALGGQTGSSGNQDRFGALAELTGTVQRDHVLGGDATATGSVQRTPDGTLLQGTIDQRGPGGYLAGSVVHRVGGTTDSTQYGLSLQTSIGASAHGLIVGAREQQDSMIEVVLGGKAKAVAFEVLVNDAPQGRIHPGGRVSIAVSPYRRYVVRLRPLGGELVAFDAAAKTVDIYPGTVAALGWRADPVLAMFGRLVRPDGSAIGNADIHMDGAISATDDRGYFQLQAPGDAVLSARSGGGPACHATLAAKASDKGYTAIGDVVCRP